MKKQIKLGWAETSITPDKRIMLSGQFYDRISQYVETPITATALAIDSGSDQAIIVSVDITHIYQDLLAAVRKKVDALGLGIDVSKIIMSATHTHTSFVYASVEDTGLSALSKYLGLESAPMFGKGNEKTDNVMSPEEATLFLVDRLSEVVVSAWNNRAPGYFAGAFGRAAVGMCRRVCYKDGSAQMWGDVTTPDFFELEGGNDNGLELMFIYDADKKVTGVVANLACPAQVLEQRYFISSDFWGKVKILLRRRFGENFKVLGICAPAGDQCPRDLVRWVEPETPIEDPNVIRKNPPERRADPSMYDVRGTWKIGRRIASEIEAIYDEDAPELCATGEFAHVAVDMPLPLRRVTEEENAEARRILKEFAATHDKSALGFDDSASMHVYAGIAERYDLQKTVTNVNAEVHVIRLGDMAIASDPFELFLNFANIVRARSAAAQTFMIQLACNGMGYLPTEKAERGGHYSGYVSSGFVGHEGGYLLAENTLDIIAKLFNK